MLLAVGLVHSALAFDPVAARHGMVVTSDPVASRVGLQILKAGGNAVDAAVAVGFALAVIYPYAGNIGGGGFMLIRLADGKKALIDYREEAPGAATRNMYLDSHGKVIPELPPWALFPWACREPWPGWRGPSANMASWGSGE